MGVIGDRRKPIAGSREIGESRLFTQTYYKQHCFTHADQLAICETILLMLCIDRDVFEHEQHIS